MDDTVISHHREHDTPLYAPFPLKSTALRFARKAVKILLLNFPVLLGAPANNSAYAVIFNHVHKYIAVTSSNYFHERDGPSMFLLWHEALHENASIFTEIRTYRRKPLPNPIEYIGRTKIADLSEMSFCFLCV